jgi:two-component system sensor histidine kinase DegS
MESSSAISKIRARPRLHYTLVITLAIAIIFLYYTYAHLLPDRQHWLEWFGPVFYFEFRNGCVGILLLVPILYAVLTLGWKQSSVVLLVLLACIASHIIHWAFHPASAFTSFAFLAVPALAGIGTELTIRARQKERRALAEKEEQRLALIKQIFRAQEDERRRIARGLHDGVTQTVLGNASLARSLLDKLRSITDENSVRDLAAIEDNSLLVVDEIRRICRDLRPSALDHLGFLPSIRWLVDNFREETGIDVEFSSEGDSQGVAPDASTALFRIVQESLSNIRQHAKATKLTIRLKFIDSNVSIRIQDNGNGFALPEHISTLGTKGKFGLIGLHERAESIGARLEIQTHVGHGTEIKITMENGKLGDEAGP